MQQLGQKFLRKYHCPVCPVVCCWRILSAKIRTKILSYIRFALLGAVELYPRVRRARFLHIHIHTWFLLFSELGGIRRLKHTAYCLRTAEYKNNIFAKSALPICSHTQKHSPRNSICGGKCVRRRSPHGDSPLFKA